MECCGVSHGAHALPKMAYFVMNLISSVPQNHNLSDFPCVYTQGGMLDHNLSDFPCVYTQGGMLCADKS